MKLKILNHLLRKIHTFSYTNQVKERMTQINYIRNEKGV